MTLHPNQEMKGHILLTFTHILQNVSKDLFVIEKMHEICLKSLVVKGSGMMTYCVLEISSDHPRRSILDADDSGITV